MLKITREGYPFPKVLYTECKWSIFEVIHTCFL